MLYIFWLLHQTTTCFLSEWFFKCCISFDSYIKPQLDDSIPHINCVVYLLTPTSNHNWIGYCSAWWCVVYLLTPTSNHNAKIISTNLRQVVYLLTPTSNHNLQFVLWFTYMLYIFWLLHQTTTNRYSKVIEVSLYIFWLLHQTTTL